ncbi:MAG: selenium-dependent molybdenum cofactor biosynthesis protein YqeB [Bacillota bacterium]
MSKSFTGNVLIKGAGDIASGTAYRLYKAGFNIAMSEIENPTVVRRTVSFAECVYRGKWEVEGITSVYIDNINEINKLWSEGIIPVFNRCHVEDFKKLIKPEIVVDARMMKRKNDTEMGEGSIVIGLGPGFKAGANVNAVIETYRGHYLGRAIYQGEAMSYKKRPGEVPGYSIERVVSAPAEGTFTSERKIGEKIEKGEVFGYVDSIPVKAKISGVIRGMIYPGIEVADHEKIGDIDNRNIKEYCFTISEKALAIGGGVLEAVLYFSKDED